VFELLGETVTDEELTSKFVSGSDFYSDD